MNLLKKRQSKLNYLELTPVRCYEHEIRETDGLVNVLVPKFKDRILGRFLQPRLKYKYFKAEFDEFGTSAWLKMDGKKKVNAIASELTKEFGEKIQPINPRLSTFCNQLYNEGFITFIEIERK